MSDLSNSQEDQRREKLKQWRQQGQVYPNDFKRSHLASEILERSGALSAEELEAAPQKVKVAGRMMMRRLMGKASFVHLQDMSGHIQLYVREQTLSEAVPHEDQYEQFKQWDLGDLIGAEGVLFRTKTGELSVKTTRLVLLAKSLKPLPDKFHGLVDQELCYRQRYVDLMVNEKTRRTFEIRSQVVQGIRNYLVSRKFLEVETPMMHPIPGGAAARPFTTHHHALDIPLFLRIAPELYLKRLVVGGFERVFEINRNFRNEGVSTRHNPEFTMLEFYQAYADYQELMALTQDLFKTLALAILGSSTVPYQGHILDFSKAFAQYTVSEAIVAYNPEIRLETLRELGSIKALVQSLGLPTSPLDGLGKLQMAIFEHNTEQKLVQPTFIIGYPTEVSPLARANDQDPTITDRFELFIGGREIANGFSELNDPEDQAQRFLAQVAQKQAGDEEAMHYDADYITALEYGLPPTAGEGIGIDRLVMLFADVPSIKDVILFPLMKV